MAKIILQYESALYRSVIRCRSSLCHALHGHDVDGHPGLYL